MYDGLDMSIKEWCEKFNNGDFNSPDVETQIKAGWYDWFCQDTALVRKTKKLGLRLLRIVDSKKINVDKHYVFFKNNCPLHGNLYDDFRICDRETGDVVYCIIPSSGHTRDHGKAQVFGPSNGFEKPLVEGTWSDVVKWFMTEEV